MQTTYVIVGRISDRENYFKSVTASSPEEAQAKFEQWVREEEDIFDTSREFYIEYCSTLKQLGESSSELM